MTKEQFEKLKASIAEHKHKLETDPEYREEYERISKEFDEKAKSLGWPFTKYNG